jgi:Tubulin-tyrosine ligase family
LNLHSKIQLANIVKENADILATYFPDTWIMDNEEDVFRLQKILAEKYIVGDLILKSDSVGKDGLTDQVHSVDKWLSEFWLEKL